MKAIEAVYLVRDYLDNNLHKAHTNGVDLVYISHRPGGKSLSLTIDNNKLNTVSNKEELFKLLLDETLNHRV